MPDWNEVFQIAVPAAIGAVLGGIYLAWKAARHRAQVRAGKPVTFDAFLRAGAPPYPRWWKLGWVSAGAGPISWKPRFSILRRPIVLPASATVERVRPVSGLWETLLTNPGCRVIVASAGDLTVELAVLEIEMETALQALESGSGGAWRYRA